MERLRAFVFDHRRPLAAACAALAVLTAVDALRPSTDTTSVAVVAHDVPSGRVLTADDLTTVQVPPAARPDHLLDREAAVGRRVAGPMRAGEAVTDRRVISPRDLDGATLSMVRVDDPATLIGLRVGDRVDVLAPVTTDDGGGARAVVQGATVAVLPPGDAGAASAVGLSTSADDALVLADAAAAGGLRLIIRS